MRAPLVRPIPVSYFQVMFGSIAVSPIKVDTPLPVRIPANHRRSPGGLVANICAHASTAVQCDPV